MIADTRSHVPEGGSTGKASAASQLGTFDVKDAHCFSSDDEKRLRRVIESEGADVFNTNVQDASMELLSSSSTPLTTDQISTLFTALDANGDGRLCRSDLLMAFGFTPAYSSTSAESKDHEPTHTSTLAETGTQVDDLLDIINTAEEVRVNGRRSISEAEFLAWIKRAI
eukprot:COSAG06_NODE_6138_length_3090_cov_1.656971_3_plen_169_part_00